jgi:hypothetical protein
VTLNSVLEAAFYVLVTFASVSALAVAVLGPTAALERWLNEPVSTQPDRTGRSSIAYPSAPPNDPDARSQVA